MANDVIVLFILKINLFIGAHRLYIDFSEEGSSEEGEIRGSGFFFVPLH